MSITWEESMEIEQNALEELLDHLTKFVSYQAVPDGRSIVQFLEGYVSGGEIWSKR